MSPSIITQEPPARCSPPIVSELEAIFRALPDGALLMESHSAKSSAPRHPLSTRLRELVNITAQGASIYL
jgi:hypothetical protein